MDLRSNYYITEKQNPNKVVIVSDGDPRGVTILIKDTSDEGGQQSFSLPRVQMIEALKYVLQKIEAR